MNSRNVRIIVGSIAATAIVTLLLVFSPGIARVEKDAPLRAMDERIALPLPPLETEVDHALDALAGDTSPDLGGRDELALDAASDAMGADPLAPLDCLIEPWEQIEIGSPVRGLIQEFHVDRADRVSAGQVLVDLDSTVEQAAVRVANARAAMDGELDAREASSSLGERRSARARKLYDNDTLSLELFEELETEAELARLELVQAREERRLAGLQLLQAEAVLGRRSVHSPIDGVVVERLMSVGERVDEEPMLRLVQLDPLRVEVILPSALFGSIEPGMKASVIPELHDENVHVAEVSVVDPIIDAASGTFGVALRLPNPDHAIPGGLHCQVRFVED